MVRILPPLALLVAAGGCTATTATFPSLLPRDIEARSDAIVTQPAPVSTPDAALDAKITAIVAGVRDAASAFDAGARQVDAVVATARGAATGSERWVAAQTALGKLTPLRAPVSGALADLERLVIDRGATGKAPYPALDAAMAEVSAVYSAQAARVAAIEAMAGQ